MCRSRNWRRSHSACWEETSNGRVRVPRAHVALADLGQLYDAAVLLDEPGEPAEGDEVPQPAERVLQPGRKQLVEVELGDELVRAQSPALLDRSQETMGVAEAGRGNGAHARNPIGALDGAREDPARAGHACLLVVARRHRAVRGLGRGGVGGLRRLLRRGRGRLRRGAASSWPRAPAGASGCRRSTGKPSSAPPPWASPPNRPSRCRGTPRPSPRRPASWPSRAARASRPPASSAFGAAGVFAVAGGAGFAAAGFLAAAGFFAGAAGLAGAAAGFLITGLDAAGLVFARGLRFGVAGGHRALGGRRGGGVGGAERLGASGRPSRPPRGRTACGFALAFGLRLATCGRRLGRGGSAGLGSTDGIRGGRGLRLGGGRDRGVVLVAAQDPAGESAALRGEAGGGVDQLLR